MPARVALLSLLLAGPALAAPPLSPTADNTAIHYEINAADPAITTPPAPVERLIAAAELAEAKLAAAVDPGEIADLLELTVLARNVAYQRTGEANHLCQFIMAAERLLAREALSPDLSADASDFRDKARAELAHNDATCAEPPQEPEPEPEPPATPEPIVTPPPEAPPPAVPREPRRGLMIAGGVLFGTAALAAIALIPVQVRRVRAFDEVSGLLADIDQAGGWTEEQAQRLSELRPVDSRTRSAKIGLTVSAAALALIGAGLVGGGSKRRSPERARVVPYGGPQGAGVGLHGRF